MQPPRRVKIIEMAHHFLYLPVHYAHHAKFFGCVPDRYELSVESTPSKTDRGAYRQLMSGAKSGDDYIGFAVADPAELLHDQDTQLSPPVVLAGLITNSSFWAVDRRTHKIRFLRDLASFDKIIAFAEGTTSNGIAHRIYRDANKRPSVRSVEPGKELTLLTSSPKGTMALTPDLLGIDKLLSDQADIYHVDLALGTTPEYNNVLVTALLSRADVVQEHPELVRGLLTAIQRAMLLVRFADPRVVKFAIDSYGESEGRIAGALRRAADAQVFPASIEVSQAHWLNAARAAADAAGRPYDDAEHDRVGHLFRSAVEPYQVYAKDAIRADILPRLDAESGSKEDGRRTSSRWFQPVVLGLAAGALLGTGFATWLQAPLVALGTATVAVGAWLTSWLPMNAFFKTLHLLWLAVALGVTIWWTSGPPDKSLVLSVAGGWLGIEITILTAVAVRRR